MKKQQFEKKQILNKFRKALDENQMILKYFENEKTLDIIEEMVKKHD